MLHHIPTSAANVPYGTPAIATEMKRLFSVTELPNTKILAMAGHEDGIIVFGSTLNEAGEKLSGLL